MKTPLQITVRNVEHSPALDARIREKAAKLEEYFPRITSCRFTVEEATKHQQKGRLFEVRIDLRVPGHEIAVTRETHQDVFVALRNAFNSARRQLQDVAREMRKEVKVHDVTQHGRVARLNAEDGFGFIEGSDGREFYFSRENVVHPPFEHLEPGMPVQFIEEIAGEGLHATRVSVGKHGG